MKHSEPSSSGDSSSSFGYWLQRVDDTGLSELGNNSTRFFASFCDLACSCGHLVMSWSLLHDGHLRDCCCAGFILFWRLSTWLSFCLRFFAETLLNSTIFFKLCRLSVSLGMVFCLSPLAVFWQGLYFVCRLHSAPFHRAWILLLSFPDYLSIETTWCE
jgi:hypothetical protein